MIPFTGLFKKIGLSVQNNVLRTGGKDKAEWLFYGR